MTNIRRYKQENQIYFLTHVTYQRVPILIDNFDLFQHAMQSIKSNFPFDLSVWVVLPDHCHLLVDPAGNDISELMRQIKLSFSMSYRKRIGITSGRVWQYRFWDHIIRDQEDLNRHIDYIHYNPIRHGLTKNLLEYPYSSFGDYCRQGIYAHDWGVREAIELDGEFGE